MEKIELQKFHNEKLYWGQFIIQNFVLSSNQGNLYSGEGALQLAQWSISFLSRCFEKHYLSLLFSNS